MVESLFISSSWEERRKIFQEAGYYFVDSDFRHLRYEKPEEMVDLEKIQVLDLSSIGGSMITKDILTEIEKRGLRPGTIWDLFRYIEANPVGIGIDAFPPRVKLARRCDEDVIRFRIVALETVWDVEGWAHVPAHCIRMWNWQWQKSLWSYCLWQVDNDWWTQPGPYTWHGQFPGWRTDTTFFVVVNPGTTPGTTA